MKILAINFSISNGGDFLIERRLNALLQKTWYDADIDFLNGYKEKIDPNINYDFIIAGGGPYFDDRVAKELFIPLLSTVIDKVKVHIIGAGVYGGEFTDPVIYDKQFSDETKSFYKAISDNGGTFGCRDEISWRIMKNNGIKNVYMTGCPAMFDFNYIESTDVVPHKINKVIISDPGLTKKASEQLIRANQAIEVIKLIKGTFPEAQIAFSFNNGINTKYSSVCNNAIKDYLVANNITFYDLSGSDAGFEKYNDADIHIGFRVHSHIYSLSRRMPSILIEEDLRGYGINETLGMPHLLASDINRQNCNSDFVPNPVLCEHLGDMIRYNFENNFARYKGVFQNMKDLYYLSYLKWVNVIKNS